MTITAEQRAMRARGIGGSDAPVIAGASQYKTRLALYLEKTGQAKSDEPTLPMKVGTWMEPHILAEWGGMMGREVHPITDTLFDEQDDRLFAHVDGCVTGLLEGVEAKWVGNPSDEWGEPGTDSVPPHVFIQCAHYLMVTGWSRWHVAAALGGREVRPYVIERDEGIISRLREIEIAFLWLIEQRIPPAITMPSDVRALYPKGTNTLSVIADKAMLGAIAQLRLVRREREDLQAIEEKLSGQIQEFMGEAGTLISTEGFSLATWKSSKAGRFFNEARFRREQRGLWDAYQEVGKSKRPFLLKQETSHG